MVFSHENLGAGKSQSKIVVGNVLKSEFWLGDVVTHLLATQSSIGTYCPTCRVYFPVFSGQLVKYSLEPYWLYVVQIIEWIKLFQKPDLALSDSANMQIRQNASLKKNKKLLKYLTTAQQKRENLGRFLMKMDKFIHFFRRFTFPYFPVHNHRLCLPAPRSTIFKFYHYLMEKVPHLKMTDRAKWTL